MSGIASFGTISFALQSAKGTPAAVPTHKFNLAGDPTLGPSKTRGRYPSTDQDNGSAYTSLMAVEGGVTVLAHPDGAAFLIAAVSGDVTSDGAGAHTIIPGDDMLWVTAFREIGGVIVERFVDCKIHALTLEGQAGQPVTIALDVIGCKSQWKTGASKTAIEAVLALDSDGYLYPEAQGKIKLNTVAQRIHRVTFGIARGGSGYQSDGYGYDDVDPGKREVTLSFATRLGSGAIGVADYAEFYYGNAAPADNAELSPVVATDAFEIEFFRSADLSFKIALPEVEYAAVPVNSSTSGDPIEVEVACEVEKPSGSPIYTVTVNDGMADLAGTPAP